MKFCKKICLMITVMLCSIMVIGGRQAFASSATVSFGTDSNSIKAGQKFTLTIVVDSSDGNITGVEARITYDESMVEVVSSDEYVKGNAGLLVLKDESESGDSTKNYEITFKALKKGNVKFECSDTPVVTDEENGQMSVSTKNLSVTIGAAADSNADSSLAVLDINQGTLNPQFDPAVYSYTASVPFETDKLFVDAQPTDASKATVAVVGNNELKVGANSVIVTVTAEDGSTTDYSITVMKESEDDSIEPGTIQSVIQDSGFNVYEDGDGNEFIQNGNAYQVLTVDDPNIIPAGYEKTKLNIFNKITITAYTVKNDLENDYMLIYCRNVDNDYVGFYQYDRVEHTLQRYTGVTNNVNVASGEAQSGTMTTNQKMTIALVGAILTALVIILLILLIKSFIKIRGLKSDDIY